MARVTVEDCVERIPNRFELVLLAAQRARNISRGEELTVDRDNDKNPVFALREIADATIELSKLERPDQVAVARAGAGAGGRGGAGPDSDRPEYLWAAGRLRRGGGAGPAAGRHVAGRYRGGHRGRTRRPPPLTMARAGVGDAHTHPARPPLAPEGRQPATAAAPDRADGQDPGIRAER